MMPDKGNQANGVRASLGRIGERLRSEFEFSVVVWIGLLAMLVISSMAIFRFFTGHVSGAVTNTVIVTLIGCVLAYAAFTPDSKRASRLFAVIATLACLGSTIMLGRTGFLWAYVVLWVNYLLADRRLALPLNLVLISGLLFQHELFDTGPERLTFVVTALLITGCGYLYSNRFDAQRRLLEELATHDPLTGAGNRRLMRRQLDQAIERFAADGRQSTLLVLDLDDFKSVNDEFGHEAGDRVLEHFAEHVRTLLRSDDGFYRMGGEEFVILLPGMNDDTARKALPKLHQRLSGSVTGPDGPIRLSAGVATLAAGEDWSRWLARADNAMYRAKRTGRDRLLFALPP
jgi:diguanylate cyclase (GGDEF)-like protein